MEKLSKQNHPSENIFMLLSLFKNLFTAALLKIDNLSLQHDCFSCSFICVSLYL